MSNEEQENKDMLDDYLKAIDNLNVNEQKFKFVVMDYSYELTHEVKDNVFTITKLVKTKISNLHKDNGTTVDKVYIENLIKDNFYDIRRVDFEIENI